MERRRAPRLAVHFLVQHTSHHDGHDGAWEVDYARDVSRSGIFIITKKTFEARSTLHVQFSPDKDASLISAFCRVTRLTPQGVAAEFISIDADALALLEARTSGASAA